MTQLSELLGMGPLHFSESMNPMTLRDVLFVPRLKKNLISVSIVEDKGLGVSFLDEHVCAFPNTL